jgi:apolipoprotein N-acyltransferase
MPSSPVGAPEVGFIIPRVRSLPSGTRTFLCRTMLAPLRVSLGRSLNPGGGSLHRGAKSAPPRTLVLVPPLLSAFLLVLALPPFHFLPLAFVALAPMAMGLALLPPGPDGGARASLQGGTFGLAFWGFSLMWVPLEVGRHFSWALPAYALLLLLLAGLSALFAWWAHRMHHWAGVPLTLAVPLAWVAVEWIKANFPLGLAFPWLGLGVALTPWPVLLGLAEWTGERGVTFWLALASGWAGAELARLGGSPVERLPRLCGGTRGFRIFVALAVLLPPLLGWARARTLSLLPGPTVAVVGTNVPRVLRDNPRAWAREALRQVEAALAHPLQSLGPDLILLPESTIPIPLGSEEGGPFFDELLSMASLLQIPLVVGAMGGVPTEAGVPNLTNSAFVVLPGRGILQRYDKRRLVPGMEAGKYQPGPGGTTLVVEGWILGPLVCYESLFGELARQGRRRGAQALLNLTSDVWFGEGGSHMGALFLGQHPAHLVLRVVELRVPAARAANGGYSFVLDPLGRISSPLLPPAGGVVVTQLHTTTGMTVFARTGDVIGPGAAFVGLLLLLGIGARRNLPRGAVTTTLPGVRD